MVNLRKVENIVRYSLPLCILDILGWNGEIFYSPDKKMQDIKRQNMSRDLFYYLSLKRYLTVNHSGQNHISHNKTTAIALEIISVIWHLASPFSISA